MTPKNPMQPIITDGQGVVRFKSNKLVEILLDHGQATGLGLNELAAKYYRDESTRDDWQQLAQLIGYSVSGFGDLSYVDDETYNAASEMADKGVSEQEAKIMVLEEMLGYLRANLQAPMAKLFGKHPDDLKRW